MQELPTEMGGSGFVIASLPEDRTRLWKARHAHYYVNVGDGNFHLGIIFDPTDPTEQAQAEGLARRVGERAIPG